MQDFCIDSENAEETFIFTILSRHVGFPLELRSLVLTSVLEQEWIRYGESIVLSSMQKPSGHYSYFM